LTDPDTFIKGCKKYHAIKPKEISYAAARYILKENPADINRIIASAKIYVYIDQDRDFEKISRQARKHFEEEVIRSYNECKEDLEKLSNKNLVEIDLEKYEILIRRIFSTFSIMPSIKHTSAAKILHLINPNMFMVWDTEIRRAFFKMDRSVRNPAKFYLMFLRKSQYAAKLLLEKRTQKALWLEHKQFMNDNFVRSFDYEETVLKMLDECNYVHLHRKLEF